MSLRYYICPVALADIEGESGYRPSLPVNVSWSTVIPSLADGTPRFAWALVLVDATDHTAVEATSGVISLGLSPDSPMSGVPQSQRSAFTTKVRQHVPGFTINWETDTARDVADRLAAWAEPAHVRGALVLGGQF